VNGCTERALTFECGGEMLLGIVATPAQPRSTAVLLVVGGPQYRAGSHRHYTLLARRLAAAGFVVLRFDVRGMGDSGGAPRGFESVGDDIRAAIDALTHEHPAVQDIALWGLCDAASAALLYCGETADPRVSALALVNPWVRSRTSEARTRVKHYYAQRLVQREFWAKLLRGQVAASALAEFGRHVREARLQTQVAPPMSYQERMGAAWRRFEGPLLLVLSGRDFTAKEFIDHVESDAAWHGALDHPGLARLDFAEADHTFSDSAARAALEAATLSWLEGNPP
jgi:exosortase A-associated hydrolase 1